MKKLLLSLITITVLGANAQDTTYVNQNATGADDGTSWTDAYLELRDAPIGDSLDQIWIAAGTYKPSFNDRNIAFKFNAAIYGGFNGTETQLSQRDWVANPTILSGDILVVGDSTDNSRTVLRINSTVGRASRIVDGFTISDGYADDGAGGRGRYGGGIYIDNNEAPVIIKNCIIKDNMAHYEGGVYCLLDVSGTKNITIENTRFTNNYARSAAAFGFVSGSGTLNANLVNCLIDNNRTGPFPIGSTNSGFTYPGGRFSQTNTGNINGKIINCIFTKNTEFSTVGNAARSVVGITGSSTMAEIYNTIFYDNDVNTLETSIGFGTNATFTPINVNVYNTISEDIIGNLSYVAISNNNTQVDPLFTNPALDDFILQSSSPAINTGDTTGILAFIPTTDLSGGVRIDGSSIDIGCYEFQESVGVNEIQNQNSISVYPNPATSQLTLKSSEKIKTVTIIDIMGKTVETITPTSNTIDVSNLVKGIYFLQVQTEKGTLKSKFIKE